MPLTSTSTSAPQNFLVILYPGHQLLDSAGPLDILSTITKTPEGENFTLTLAAETLETVPLPPFPPKGSTWDFEETPELITVRGEPGRRRGSGFDVPLRPHVTFSAALDSLRRTGKIEVENVLGQKEHRTVDVLFIPGGIGSRLYRVDRATGAKTLNVDSAVDFARAVCLEGLVQSIVMTVCTGSDLFARTGLLEGRRATTNHLAFKTVAGRHGGVRWLERRRWVRSLPQEVGGESGVSGKTGSSELDVIGSKGSFEREVWTSAGISAGMDLTLWFVAEVYGREFARGIARRLEYEWREGVGEGEIDPYY